MSPYYIISDHCVRERALVASYFGQVIGQYFFLEHCRRRRHQPTSGCHTAAPPICCLATLEKFLVGCNVLPMTAYGRVQARSVNPSLKVSLVRGGSSSRETLRRRRLQVSAKPMRCALPSWTMWTDCPRHQALSSTKSLSCFASLLLLPVKSGWVDY